ncbi:MAG: hypothetical protein C4526_06065 [Nitrospiraceae bacterium]|nr:MAG: hypothetical protein C4526_06065 [Nitrospiraceae bacterium]
MRNKTLSILTIVFLLAVFQGLEAFAAKVPETAPSADPQNSFSFVVWGHPRGKATGEPPLHFEEILERITELKADLLIITGDAIQGMWGQKTDPAIITADWERFDAGVNRLGIPVYRIPGNHDVHNNVTRDVYLSRYPGPPYAFTFKGNRFILLDTAGIKQQGKDDQTTWEGLSQPFDDEQFGFIKDEIGRQNEYKHIFIFMHNPQPWSEPSTFWWESIHPLLRSGKTRAVFAGSPWYFKYAHMEQDGIHYILSSCLSAPQKEFFRMFPNPDEWAIHKQLDNIQYVRVEGDKYIIRTIAVGALNSPQLNWRFWDEVERRPPGWAKKFMVRFYKKFYKPGSFALLAAAFGGVCVLTGAFITVVWMRRRSRNMK